MIKTCLHASHITLKNIGLENIIFTFSQTEKKNIPD